VDGKRCSLSESLALLTTVQVGLGAFPALTQLAMLFFMPETPRYLARQGREEAARHVLKKVYKGSFQELDGTVDSVLSAIRNELLEEEESHLHLKNSKTGSTVLPPTLQSLLFHAPHVRALTITCMLQALQQLCGFNSLMYFSATIFSLLNFSSPTLTSLSIALTNFLFTVLAFYLIDRTGRRRILLYTIPIMAVALVLCAVSFTFITMPPGNSHEVKSSAPASTSVAATAVLASLILYVSSYATGLGPVPWQQAELFPLSVRSLGSSLATSTNWACNTVVGLTFLPMMEWLTPGWTFVCYAVVCGVGWVAVWLIYPETMGLDLEGVSELLRDGWGVEESMVRVREWKRRQNLDG